MVPDEGFEQVVQSYRGERGVTTARMFGSYGLKVNGKVFAMLYKGQLVVKLPAARAAQLVSGGRGRYFSPGKGKVMKEWVAVTSPPGAGWRRLADEAKAFVGALRRSRP